MRRAFFLILLAGILATACSGDKPFKISGELSDGSTTNLYLKYYGDYALNTLITAAREGKFAAQGSVMSPTVVRVLDKDNKLLALVFVRNGDEISVNIDRSDPWASRVTGNEVNDSLTSFLNANASTLSSRNAKEINNLIAEYIKSHPDDEASAVLLGYVYDASVDPAETAELLASLGPKAKLPYVVGNLTIQAQRFASASALGNVEDFKYMKAGVDSALMFKAKDKAASLLVFSDDKSERADSIVPKLKEVYKGVGRDKLQILDIIISNDTTAMKGLTRRDSAEWTQAWTPGGLLSDQLYPLAIPALPYYIVTDTAGRQVYRGPSAAEARKSVEKITK